MNLPDGLCHVALVIAVMYDRLICSERQNVNQWVRNQWPTTNFLLNHSPLQIGSRISKCKNIFILRVICYKPIKPIHIQYPLPDFCLCLPILGLISDKMPSWIQFLPYVWRFRKSVLYNSSWHCKHPSSSSSSPFYIITQTPCSDTCVHSQQSNTHSASVCLASCECMENVLLLYICVSKWLIFVQQVQIFTADWKVATPLAPEGVWQPFVGMYGRMLHCGMRGWADQTGRLRNNCLLFVLFEGTEKKKLLYIHQVLWVFWPPNLWAPVGLSVCLHVWVLVLLSSCLNQLGLKPYCLSSKTSVDVQRQRTDT